MQNGSQISIYSIFRSINGEICREGQGSWATFIRFAGCNLRCSWCDTKYALDGESGKLMSVDDIMQEVHNNQCSNVTITGGEPLLQREGLKKLIRQLLIHNFRVSIETNGSFPIITRTHLHESHDLSWVVDYKLPSSDHTTMMSGLSWAKLSWFDYIKFVIVDRRDYDVAVSTVQKFWWEGVKAQMVFSPVIGPITGSSNATEMLKWMKENHLFSVKVSLQLHKLIDFGEPK